MLDDFLFPRLGGDLHADPYDGPSPVEALLPVARQDPGEALSLRLRGPWTVTGLEQCLSG